MQLLQDGFKAEACWVKSLWLKFRCCQWMLPSLLHSRTRRCLTIPGLLCHPLVSHCSLSPAFWLVHLLFLLFQFSRSFPWPWQVPHLYRMSQASWQRCRTLYPPPTLASLLHWDSLNSKTVSRSNKVVNVVTYLNTAQLDCLYKHNSATCWSSPPPNIN